MKKLSLGTLISIVVGLLILAVGIYSAVASSFLALASSAYNKGNYDSAIAHAKRYDSFVPFDKHKGPFNVGTALAAKGELDAAEDELRTALDLTPERDECAVRQNLSAVIEEKSNVAWEADRRDEAKKLLEEAKKISTDAPEGCRQNQQKQNMDQAEKRMDQTEQERKEQEEEEKRKEEEEKKKKEQEKKDGDKQKDQGDGGEEMKKDSSDGGDDPTQDGDSGNDPGEEDKGSGDGDSNGAGGAGSDQPSGKGSEEGTDPKQEELAKRNEDAQGRQNNDQSSGSSWSDKPW
ncbi:tetratricopeptide repeat protein [Brevibacterium mcbrellneri ATCC 49030]|uniref:Tetratricopeptide repeat protein n=1 Tax=Brevibacterium mcbrellneri ATCC 49030 TaxID=585530 RepID=D4YLY5_9MICO|nr:hypothetical protein [Brevibacterium mcbrellneri]EFG47868.1 tetratricopeptide repeat protein [Brevibacterium mcbrellneri ATCC 49030]